jgi:hypothetical protein
MKRYLLALALAFLGSAGAFADVLPGPGPEQRPRPVKPVRPIAPVPAQANRDPVALARRDPMVARQLAAARGGDPQTGPQRDETAVQVALGGQCGFAGCSSTTLVVFTFRSKGANTATQSVLALVSCGPVGDSCKVEPAEVRALASVQR